MLFYQKLVEMVLPPKKKGSRGKEAWDPVIQATWCTESGSLFVLGLQMLSHCFESGRCLGV